MNYYPKSIPDEKHFIDYTITITSCSDPGNFYYTVCCSKDFKSLKTQFISITIKCLRKCYYFLLLELKITPEPMGPNKVKGNSSLLFVKNGHIFNEEEIFLWHLSIL